jgi:hypothetical protein
MLRFFLIPIIGASSFLHAIDKFSTTAWGQTAPPTTVAPAANQEWVKVELENSGLSLLMPGKPEKKERKMSPVPNKTTTVHLNVVSLSATNSFVFAHNKLTENPITNPQKKDTLDGGVTGAVARTLGDLVSVKSQPLNGQPGREFVFTCIQGDQGNEVNLKVASRLILIGDTLYQLTYVAQTDEFSEEQMRKFLDSVTYTPPDPNK